MTFGNRFDYYYSDGPTGDIVYWWDTESPLSGVPLDVVKILANFGEVVSGYTISGDDCTDMYLYFGDSDPPPLVASFESGLYVASIEYEIPSDLVENTRYYLKATFENCTNYGGSITYTGYFDTIAAPGKAQNPTPADDEEDIKITGINKLKKFQWEAPA